MAYGAVQFIPEKLLNIWVIPEPGIVAVVERGNGGRDLALSIQYWNQDMLFVVWKFNEIVVQRVTH